MFFNNKGIYFFTKGKLGKNFVRVFEMVKNPTITYNNLNKIILIFYDLIT